MEKKAIKISGAVVLALITIFALISIFSWGPTMTASAQTMDTPDLIAVTFHGDVTTSRGFNWRTRGSNTPAGYVQVWERRSDDREADFRWHAANGTLRSFEARRDSSTIHNRADAPTRTHHSHRAVAGGLNPGTAYWYRVGSDVLSGWSPIAQFETTPENLDNFTFFHVADTQGTYNNMEVWENLINHAFDRYPHAKFMAHAGDIVQEGHDSHQWEGFFNRPQNIMMNSVIAPAAGNHDFHRNAFQAHFNLDFPEENRNTRHGIERGIFYSFTVGNAHFTVLNTNDIFPTGQGRVDGITQAQIDWFEQDISSNDATWRIVMTHKPFYSTGDKARVDQCSRANSERIVPLMLEHGIDIVVQGHDHVFMRTKPQTLIEGTVRPKYVMPETIVEYRNGQLVTHMLNPEGIIYLNINSSAVTSDVLFYPIRPDIFDPNWRNSDGNLGPHVNDYWLHAFPEVTAQPGMQMFSAITINGSELTLNSYTVERSTYTGRYPVRLFDSFSIRKNSYREVVRRIRNLPDVSEITPAHRTVVQSIISEYNRLSVADQTLVDNIDELWVANAAIQEVMREDAMEEFADLINNGTPPSGCGASSIALGGVALATLATLSALLFVKSKEM
ncbi:MAG: metallophosphoesterase family protein [Firmicutes bacterium]|nr:metallophosphoesterase family protein [Bacillota bacterium]